MGKIYSESNSANKAFRLSKIIAPLHIILCTYKHQSKARIHPTEKKIIKVQLNTVDILFIFSFNIDLWNNMLG
jgi:hypothetical protein